jgi:hypothetical protein
LGCLAHAPCLVGSEGIAAVIDPQRDVDIYLDAAKQKGLKIEHIIETHLARRLRRVPPRRTAFGTKSASPGSAEDQDRCRNIPWLLKNSCARN